MSNLIVSVNVDNNNFQNENSSTPSIDFTASLLEVKGLKLNTHPVKISQSMLILIGSKEETMIVQLLHLLALRKRGFVVKGCQWFEIPVRIWQEKILTEASTWNIRNYIKSLVDKKIIYQEQLYKEIHGDNYNKKNRTYYYRLNYDELSKLASKAIALQNNKATGGAD